MLSLTIYGCELGTGKVRNTYLICIIYHLQLHASPLYLYGLFHSTFPCADNPLNQKMKGIFPSGQRMSKNTFNL